MRKSWLRYCNWTSKMARRVKVLAAKPGGTGVPSLGPTMWKERAGSSVLLSDLQVCCGACLPAHTRAHTTK